MIFQDKKEETHRKGDQTIKGLHEFSHRDNEDNFFMSFALEDWIRSSQDLHFGFLLAILKNSIRDLSWWDSISFRLTADFNICKSMPYKKVAFRNTSYQFTCLGVFVASNDWDVSACFFRYCGPPEPNCCWSLESAGESGGSTRTIIAIF